MVRFSEFLKDKVDISQEGYELKFLGKNYAKMIASLDTETVIVPDDIHNNQPAYGIFKMKKPMLSSVKVRRNSRLYDFI